MNEANTTQRLAQHVEAVREYILSNWDDTIVYPGANRADEDSVQIEIGRVLEGPDGTWEEIRLPHPFSAPSPGGKDFQNLFYWDAYFTAEGLVRSGRVELARNGADNILHLIRALGFMPNANALPMATRSQPPVASAFVRLIYGRTGDKAWLRRAHEILEREYAFWMTLRATPTGLNSYGHHANVRQLERFEYSVRNRLRGMPRDPAARLLFLAHAMAEAESGWDFNPRFDRRCLDFVAVDLNALLYIHETNAAWFCRELGVGEADMWEKRAAVRKETINALCWCEESGFYFDYDFVNKRRSMVPCAAAFFPLWAGIPTEQQAERMAANLPLLEREHGLLACAHGQRTAGQTYQWDSPNMWPPTVFAAIEGMRRYGYEADACRIAAKYVQTLAQSFEKTGQLWEKYNAVSGGVDVADEYPMPPMLGWTAGVFLHAYELIQHETL